MSSSLKEQKEAFVTGHEGTSVLEILLVCSCTIVGGLWALQQFLLTPAASMRQSKSKQLLIEALFLLLPSLIAQTEYLYPFGVIVLAIEILCAVVMTMMKRRRQPNTDDDHDTDALCITTTITCYRSIILLLTCIAILAVDFHVFPRRFAKTEIYGYGWMDLGAGSFVVAAGLSSRRARGLPQDVKKSIQRILPLLILAIIRLVTNKGLEYQEHVSEYGVHWNFFLTLAGVTVLSALVPFSYSTWVVILLMAVYQIALKHFGLQTYVEEASRRCEQDRGVVFCHFFAANREGILGCIGYLSLYLASEKVGHICLWKNSNYHGWHLSVAAALFWGIHYQLTELRHIPTSRRTTNASFCAWTMAHNITMLTFIHTIVASSKSATSPPPILQAINRHGLLVFVVANLFTGLVNLSMNTLEARDGVALLVLSIYLSAVSGVAVLADYIIPSKDKRSKEE